MDYNIDVVKSIIALGGMALIIGLVQIVKQFISDSRFYPIVAVVLGLLINLVANLVLRATGAVDWFAGFINGTIVGLAASGLYSATDTMRNYNTLPPVNMTPPAAPTDATPGTTPPG